MIIEKIVFLPKSKNYTVFFSDGSGTEIIEDTLVKFNLYKGMEIEPDTISNIKYENQKFEAAKSVFRYIQNKKTVKEVKDYLSKKGYDEDVVELTADYLVEKGYIDDRKYVSAFVNDKLKINKYGRNKIKNQLIVHGIDKDLAESAVYNLDENIEYENLKSHAEKKFKTLKKDMNTKSKLINHLIYKGYQYDMIKNVLKEFDFGYDE
ncbi:regulatory protein [Peptoniphilus asaccharolyticus DSM 20463]|uniref:Regulatory protein RecX n=1 Tax=Peptoniphilus asaccharolyticus DSM 20463 TaxID=573058 RepID=A0A1W1UVD5_PEPAS|nr:RecX family transcriptional regulator [Peptoniphilus asaccharolyticus]MBL7575260.1 RecX family transcriptional regulator [Peptoniphilus asaccharolyticus]SMB85128.1 regulatory protein [Peptoniphilus asaccharolyticus DSM 20463]